MTRRPPAILLPVRSAAYSLLGCLRAAKIPVIVLAFDRRGAETHSRHPRVVRLEDGPDYDAAILKALDGLRAEGGVLFPAIDAHVRLLIRHRVSLERDFRLCLPPSPVAELFCDKADQATALLSAGFDVPRFVGTLPENPEELVDVLGDPSMVFKPRIPKNGMGFKLRRARNPGEVAAVYRMLDARRDGAMAQAHVPGDVSALWTCNCVFGPGHELISIFIYRKLRTNPVEHGVATVAVSRNNPELVELARRFGKTMRYVGPADIEFKRDPSTGRYWYIEANPRFTKVCDFAARCGVNQVDECYRLALGDTLPVRPPSFIEGVYYVNYPLEIRARRSAGESWLRVAVAVLTLLMRHPQVGAVEFSVRDPWPYVRRWFRLAWRAAWFPVRLASRPLRVGTKAA